MTAYTKSISESGFASDSPVRVVKASRSLILEIDGGMPPSTTLYPSTSLYPTAWPDKVGRQVTHFREPIESLSLTEQPYRIFERKFSISESLATSDLLSQLRSFNITIMDYASDATLVPETSLYPSTTLSPTNSAVDMVSRIYGANRSDHEIFSLSDILTKSHSAKRQIVENVPLPNLIYPNASVLPGASLTPTNTGITDYVTYHLTNVRSFIEGHSLTDMLKSIYEAHRSLTETYFTSEAISRSTPYHRHLSEAYKAVDKLYRLHNAQRNFNDILSLADIVKYRSGVVRFTNEGLVLTDAPTALTRHLHAQYVVELLTSAYDTIYLQSLLPVYGEITYDPVSGLTTYNLPDWGFVLAESTSLLPGYIYPNASVLPTGQDSMFWTKLTPFVFTPYREK